MLLKIEVFLKQGLSELRANTNAGTLATQCYTKRRIKFAFQSKVPLQFTETGEVGMILSQLKRQLWMTVERTLNVKYM